MQTRRAIELRERESREGLVIGVSLVSQDADCHRFSVASILRCDAGSSPAEFSGDGWIGRFCEVSDEDMPKLSKCSCGLGR